MNQSKRRVAPALKDQPRWLRKYIKGPGFYAEHILPTLHEAMWDVSLFPMADLTDIIPGAVLVREIAPMAVGLAREDGHVKTSAPFNHFCVVLEEPQEKQEPSGYPGQIWRVVDLAYWKLNYQQTEAAKLIPSWIDVLDLGIPDLKPNGFRVKSKCHLLIPSPAA